MPKTAETNKVDGDMKNIRADIELLKENIVKLTQHLGENGSARFGTMKSKANEKVTYLKGQGRDQMATLEKEVKENPVQSVAIAFAAGLVTSYIFGRK
jgi:ElaB/YqjD/DUF883 family membrane-anchored ribosome-binding protein